MPNVTYPADFDSTMLPAIYRFTVSALGGPASVILPLSSTLGATVPSGSTVTRVSDGSTWILDGDVTIPALGTVDGVFAFDGPATVAALETWAILSPVLHWTAVGTNTLGAEFDWTVILVGNDGDNRRAPVPPSKPFATIDFLDLPTAEGRQWAQADDPSPTSLRMTVRNLALLRCEIQLFSNRTELVLAERLRSTLDLLYPGLDLLAAAGLVPVPSETRMRDLSKIFSSELEFRYVLEVGLRLETRFVVDSYPYISDVRPLTVTVL